MNNVRASIIHIIYFAKYLFGRKRFLGLSLPLSRMQRVFDRSTRSVSKLFVRDLDDWIQIEHIFLNEEFNLAKTARQKQILELHRRIAAAGTMPLIVDLGANIGLASRYFDKIYPGSRIIAVEPDPGNCEIAKKNLPANATLHRVAISSRKGVGDLVNTGRNCGFRVKTDSSGDVKLVTVQELLAEAKGCAPFLIKIDIEGFESDLFSENTDWIDLFPILLIELHDWMLPGKHVTKSFLQEISRREREFMHFDGYVVSVVSDLTEFAAL